MGSRPRVATQSGQEGYGSDEGEGGEIVIGASVIARGDASPVLEATEHALDEVSAFVGGAVEGDRPGPPSAGGDDGFDLPLLEKEADRMGVVSFVTEQPTR